MSKNIIIEEGGNSYRFTAKKLKTDKAGGGAVLWVPEDEVSLGTKSVTANGTYKASDDGKYGFSQFTVNVAGGNGSADNSGKPISSGGDPDIGSSFIGIDPTDGEPYEYTVNPQGEVEKTPVSTATPSDIGSSFIGIDPTDGEPYEYTVNPQGEVEKTPMSTVTPGGPGSGVVGTDPEDGNEYFIGIDENGGIVKTKIPSGIEIAKTPDKTSYAEGETINYSGIIVILKGGDSAIFSNASYPNGRIPFSELSFPVKTAHYNGTTSGTTGGGGYSDDSGGSSSGGGTSIDPGGSGYSDNSGGDGTNASSSSLTYMSYSWVSNNSWWPNILVYGREPGEVNTTGYDYASITNWSYYTPKNIYWCVIDLNGNSIEGPIYGPAVGSVPDLMELLPDYSGSGTVSIPVIWKSRYKDESYTAYFSITVNDGGSTDGGGYSDDSGGSSSGGGTSF